MLYTMDPRIVNSFFRTLREWNIGAERACAFAGERPNPMSLRCHDRYDK